MLRSITILNAQRAKSSNLGNPSYYVTYIESTHGEKFYGTAITGTNCAIGYQISGLVGCDVTAKFSNRKKLNLPVIEQVLTVWGKQQ